MSAGELTVRRQRAPSPSEEGLIQNVARFCRVLRENDLWVPLSSVLDAVRGLSWIDLGSPWPLYHLLRCNVVCRREDLEKFDALFRRFWFSESMGAREIEGQEDTGPEPGRTVPFSSQSRERGSSRPLRYSAQPSAGDPTLDALSWTDSAELCQWIRRLLHPLASRPGRRTQFGRRGTRISLSRLLRKNVQHGGEPVVLEFKIPRPRRRRVLFLCDVSGSMDMFRRAVLRFVHALMRVERKTEVLFFSTQLTRVTALFGLMDFSTALTRLPRAVTDWGGGTRIGSCLRTLHREFGGSLLVGKPVVIIYSDGWDRGEIDLLEGQMAALKRKAHRVIWLNPLLGTQDYQPICRGMSAALPFVDLFLPASSLADLQRLGRKLGQLIS
jgi:uncharacterized protein